jgi:leader peptidase (prepilin peptidase) / N-methyltransferase
LAPALVLTAIVGLALGSFLNVLIHRLPLGESLVSPGSHCPRCDAPVASRDNVPIASWLLLRGRCRHCAQPISPRYPLVEAMTAALFVAVVADKSSAVDITLGLVLVFVLVPLALIDLDHRILPNRIVVPAAVVAIAVGTALDPGGEPERLIAGAGAGAFFLVFVLAYPRGMGMGDVKLAAMLGLFLGRGVAPAILTALIVGVLIGGVLMRRVGVRAGRKTAIPFGPMLALGGLAGLYAGNAIVSWYLDTFT